MGKDLVLMNICPNSERLPLKFYLFYIKNPKAKNNNLYYDSLRKVKLNNLEQEFINERGKEIWNKKLL